jgi:hypothetical protein
MRICRTAEGLSVVSDSIVFVIFITPAGEVTARNTSESFKRVNPGRFKNK